MSHPSESTPTVWTTLLDWGYRVFQLIDLRLALAIGLITFLIAVSFDSAGNSAAAADLLRDSAGLTESLPVVVINQAESTVNGLEGFRLSPGESGQESINQLATARRLRHGTLTGALMTSSRLTQAHFFTDLPSGE